MHFSVLKVPHDLVGFLYKILCGHWDPLLTLEADQLNFFTFELMHEMGSEEMEAVIGSGTSQMSIGRALYFPVAVLKAVEEIMRSQLHEHPKVPVQALLRVLEEIAILASDSPTVPANEPPVTLLELQNLDFPAIAKLEFLGDDRTMLRVLTTIGRS